MRRVTDDIVAAKARAPRASAFSERHQGCRARSSRRISEGGKIGKENMETHAGREKIRPRCKWIHVRIPEAAITLLCVNIFKNIWA